MNITSEELNSHGNAEIDLVVVAFILAYLHSFLAYCYVGLLSVGLLRAQINFSPTQKETTRLENAALNNQNSEYSVSLSFSLKSSRRSFVVVSSSCCSPSRLDLLCSPSLHPQPPFSRLYFVFLCLKKYLVLDCGGVEDKLALVLFTTSFYLIKSLVEKISNDGGTNLGFSLLRDALFVIFIPKCRFCAGFCFQMDCKKFIQLVEEKKKRVLDRKEAPMKWQQKLEAAFKAKAEAEAKERKAKAAKRHKKRSLSDSDSESGSDESKKSKKRSSRRHRKHSHSDSGEEKKGVRSKHRKRRHSSESDDSSDDYDSSSEEDRRRVKRSHKRHKHRSTKLDSSTSDSSSEEEDSGMKKRSHKKHRRHHRRSGSSGYSSEEDDGRIKRNHAKHHKHHRRPKYSDSETSSDDEDGTDRRSHKRVHKCRHHHHHHHGSDHEKADHANTKGVTEDHETNEHSAAVVEVNGHGDNNSSNA